MFCILQFISSFGILKKVDYIFTFIFLLTMVFSVVVYLPLIEEEIGHHKIELCKKLSGDESADEDSGDNSEPDDWGTYSTWDTVAWTQLLTSEDAYLHQLHLFSNYPTDTSTPPPKI